MGRDFAFKLQRLQYDAMERFDWPHIDNAIEHFQFSIHVADPQLPSAEGLVWASRLNSVWQQIWWLYRSLGRTAIEAYGYWHVVNEFATDEEKGGVKYSFQSSYEDFLYRLFSFKEMTAQLSNVYHRCGFDPSEVRPNYWKELKRSLHDDFIEAVEAHMHSPSLEKLRGLRNSMTHRMVFDMVGIGWGTLSPRVNAEGKITGFGIGARYAGALDFESALEDLRMAFHEVTEFLTKVQRLVQDRLVAWESPVTIQ